MWQHFMPSVVFVWVVLQNSDKIIVIVDKKGHVSCFKLKTMPSRSCVDDLTWRLEQLSFSREFASVKDFSWWLTWMHRRSNTYQLTREGEREKSYCLFSCTWNWILRQTKTLITVQLNSPEKKQYGQFWNIFLKVANSRKPNLRPTLRVELWLRGYTSK